jgi:glycosyltransferase involved in cell wall biosynthesis
MPEAAPRPLRFCLLSTFYPPWSFGGDGIHVRRLARELVARGHAVTVVHSPEAYRTLARRSPAPTQADPGVRVIPIDARLGGISPLATYLTGQPLLTRGQLARALDNEFDVLHFHNPSLLGGPGVLRMGSGLKIYTIHEQWLVCPTHVLWRYGREICDAPRCVRCTLSYRRPPQPWRYTNVLPRALADVDALLAPSRNTIRLHARYAAQVRIEHLHLFAPDDSQNDLPPYQHHRPYFLYAGRLEQIKAVDTLIETFRRRRYQDLLIVGTGSEERKLRAAAADLPNVHFLGWQKPARLGALYRGALALLVSTQGYENFPLVILEAFSRGVPVVAFRRGALEEAAEDSGAVLLYRGDDELDAALDRLAGDPRLRAELGSRGRAAFQQQWTATAYLRRYLRLIAELATDSGRAELAATAAAWAERAGAAPSGGDLD